MLFIQHEISNSFVDDFIVLPAERIIGNVYCGLTSAVQRHSDFFVFTH